MSTPTSNPTDAPNVDRVGQLISGRYRICSLVGEGGMGAVYLAEHTHMKKRFALKLLHPEMAKRDEVLARFRREAEAAAHVEHPNIVAATDFGQTDDGAFFLVLEYVDGITLRDNVARGPFPTARALHIARQIALALDRAHGAGIVHRDLKPENVMLITRAEDPDFVKVLDFGVARFDHPSGANAEFLTQAGTVMGTPSYMAPEQAVGDRVTHRADLYALGCVLYEMLTGHVPFAGDLMQLLTMHVMSPVPPMSEIAPGIAVPAPIEALVRKLLEKDANDRYPTARALVDAIDQAVLEIGLDVPWGSPISERMAAAATGALVVAPPGSRVVAHAKTEHLPSRGANKVAAMLGRLSPHRERLAKALAPVLARAKVLLSPVLARANAHLERIAIRLKVPKRVVLGVLGGAAALALVLAIVVVRREPHPASSGTGSKLLGLVSGGTASAEELRAAATKGPASLEQLSALYPKDPAVARELAFAYDAAGRNNDALRVVRLAVEADPKSVPRDLLRVVMRAASKVEASDEAFRLLEGPLGADGVDALIELAESKDVPASTSSRAQKSLTKASVRANASPALVFLLDLANASTCEVKHDVLVGSGSQADARALSTLRALEVKSGCGRRRRFDCHPCLRKDDALARAIEAAQSDSTR
jgi:serine/threonine-protein kinase